jgi:DNA-binding PucR family transcriptional regulator
VIRTIRAFADCSLNVKETARRLGVHADTIYVRLNQIKKRTGADPRTFAGTSFLLTALRLLDMCYDPTNADRTYRRASDSGA